MLEGEVLTTGLLGKSLLFLITDQNITSTNILSFWWWWARWGQKGDKWFLSPLRISQPRWGRAFPVVGTVKGAKQHAWPPPIRCQELSFSSLIPHNVSRYCQTPGWELLVYSRLSIMFDWDHGYCHHSHLHTHAPAYNVSPYEYCLSSVLHNMLGLSRWCSGTESARSAGDARDEGLIPGSGRSPGVENGNPLQYSCLENSMDRGAWWATIYRVGRHWGTEHVLHGLAWLLEQLTANKIS